MGRVDYLDDPSAPPANSIVPSVTAIVTDHAGRLLMVHRTDNDLWSIPGGAMDVGESISDAVVREVKEETGIEVVVVGLVGNLHQP
jgi:ADP-ribose pyrophosphatase YjhB (NUDIX family)